jgi:hypothetical protein
VDFVSNVAFALKIHSCLISRFSFLSSSLSLPPLFPFPFFLFLPFSPSSSLSLRLRILSLLTGSSQDKRLFPSEEGKIILGVNQSVNSVDVRCYSSIRHGRVLIKSKEADRNSLTRDHIIKLRSSNTSQRSTSLPYAASYLIVDDIFQLHDTKQVFILGSSFQAVGSIHLLQLPLVSSQQMHPQKIYPLSQVDATTLVLQIPNFNNKALDLLVDL